ncbi:MAG: hypothetical protein K1X87_00910 [Dehalococcoidia bacterium]|nr:hypothetical protein [Dehalococcoidia bacterium]
MKYRIGGRATAPSLLGMSMMAFALIGGAALHPASAQTDQVTLCHRTDSVTNPYVRITVSTSAVVSEGHSGHLGVVATSQAQAESIKASGQMWGDIIPPLPNVVGLEGGLNWDAGKAVYYNNCGYPMGTPTATATLTGTATMTATATATATGTATATSTATRTATATATPTRTATSIPTTVPTTPSTGGGATGGGITGGVQGAGPGLVLAPRPPSAGNGGMAVGDSRLPLGLWLGVTAVGLAGARLVTVRRSDGRSR